MKHYSYIIVGAGAAGCVLANRLSADGQHEVLLIEAGGRDNHPLVTMPMGVGKLMVDPQRARHFPTEPDQGNGGQPRVFIRGRMLGGSSSLNGMVYCRGQPEDYDGWEAMGATGWGWSTMAAAFRAIEDHELGDNGQRGTGGPLHISIRNDPTPLTEAILTAAASLGTPRKADVNQPAQEGIGYTPVTIRNGRRVSAASAFLHPARDRANLTVVTDTQIEKLLFEGTRVIGVEGLRQGERVRYHADREVILSCGALQTPQLLLLSGIGPAAELQAAGVTPLIDLPGVGKNLLEHKTISMQVRLTQDYSVNRRLGGWRLWLSALRYFLFHNGPLASTYDLNAFIKTQSSLAQPDAQILFWALSVDKSAPGIATETEPGLLALAYPLRTSSAGEIRLRNADPTAPPLIYTNFLATDHDRAVTIGVFRYLRRLFAQPAVAPFIAAETFPGPAVQSDTDILNAARRDETCQHAVGTCRMGNDAMAVLDERLRVRGLTGLRVADLSSMPGQVSGNTAGPVMAFAWHAAALILGDAAAEQAAPSAAVAAAQPAPVQNDRFSTMRHLQER